MNSHDAIELPTHLRAWLAVGQTYLTCHRVLNTRLAALDLSVAQHEVLLTIALYPDESQSNLAARLISVKSNVSTHLRRLETRGLVQRTADERDARNKRLRLTEAGEALARRSAEVQRDVVAAMLSPLSDEEIRITEDIMRRGKRALDALERPRPD